MNRGTSPGSQPPWCDSCDERPATKGGILCDGCRALVDQLEDVPVEARHHVEAGS